MVSSQLVRLRAGPRPGVSSTADWLVESRALGGLGHELRSLRWALSWTM